MHEERIIKITFAISLTAHFIFLGLPGFNLKNFQNKKEKELSVQIEIKSPSPPPSTKITRKKIKKVKKLVKKTEPEIKKEEKVIKQKEVKKKEIEEKIKTAEKKIPEQKEEPKKSENTKIKEKSAEKPSDVQPEKGEIVKETEQKGEIENTGKIENIKEEASYGTEEKTNLKEELLLDYQKAVKKKIENCRKYPKWARRQGFEGKIHLKFTILSTGEVRDIKILKSSGFNILDKEAISTIKRASPFPPIPSELKISSLTMEISIVFKLQY